MIKPIKNVSNTFICIIFSIRLVHAAQVSRSAWTNKRGRQTQTTAINFPRINVYSSGNDYYLSINFPFPSIPPRDSPCDSGSESVFSAREIERGYPRKPLWPRGMFQYVGTVRDRTWQICGRHVCLTSTGTLLFHDCRGRIP